MPKIPGKDPLPKTRHEYFAQQIARGVANVAAYDQAGYKTNCSATASSAASRLRNQPHVRARIDWLVIDSKPVEVFDVPARLELVRNIAKTATDQRIQLQAVQEYNKMQGDYDISPKVPSPSGNLTADELSQMIAAARVIKRQGEDFMSEHARRPVRSDTDNSGFEDVSDDDVS